MTNAPTAVSTHREPELLGQTVVVIGGSAGIGLETARRARAEGASVILTGRNPERLKQAALELDAQRTAAFDANDPASLQSFFQDLPTPIDHVMVTAGAPHCGPPLERRLHRSNRLSGRRSATSSVSSLSFTTTRKVLRRRKLVLPQSLRQRSFMMFPDGRQA
jgi:NAD(P)-dependent dehydrogenase (short-subunit alcohol dehydrogenase family)